LTIACWPIPLKSPRAQSRLNSLRRRAGRRVIAIPHLTLFFGARLLHFGAYAAAKACREENKRADNFPAGEYGFHFFLVPDVGNLFSAIERVRRVVSLFLCDSWKKHMIKSYAAFAWTGFGHRGRLNSAVGPRRRLSERFKWRW
jgi:hypothetical protein